MNENLDLPPEWGKGTHHGPFAQAAKELSGHGLAVIPCGKDDGKRPLVMWPKRLLKPESPALINLITKFGEANIGILTELSGVTIVDIDDPDLVPAMLNRFGDTPLQTRTPSGGTHLWYKSDGEGSANLRGEGLAVDIKARGGFIVVPPSRRPTGTHSGKSYEFIVGGWGSLPQLPLLKPGSLKPPKEGKGTRDVPLPRVVTVGSRNDTLFTTLKNEVAPTCVSEEDLILAARRLNATFNPPENDKAVVRTARKVWSYKQNNRLFLPSGPATAVISDQEFAALVGNPDSLALALALRLKLPPDVRGVSFAVSAKAMARDQVIPGWGWRRYRAAREWLIDELGWLIVTHEGSTGKAGSNHDAWLYAINPAPDLKGALPAPNITLHPSPLPSPVPMTTPKPFHAIKSRLRRRPAKADMGVVDLEELLAAPPSGPSPQEKLRHEVSRYLATLPPRGKAGLAEKAGLSRSRLSNWLAGRDPTLSHIAQVALSDAIKTDGQQAI